MTVFLFKRIIAERQGTQEVSSALNQQTTETLSHLNIPEFAQRT